MQFVGRTTATFNGGQGVLTDTAACQTEFGPGRRMCTSEELMNTVDLPPLTGGPSWIRPKFVPVGNGSSVAVSGDISGPVRQSRGLSCNGWINASSVVGGLVVLDGGQFNVVDCNGINTIACCG
jgi:hypothetical protein